MRTNPEPILSVPGLARELKIDPATIRARLERGELTPDFVLAGGIRGESPLFRIQRLPDLQRVFGIPTPPQPIA
ncbi:MAG: hypothetical protein AB7J34_24930 [Limisphaerales bacterium]